MILKKYVTILCVQHYNFALLTIIVDVRELQKNLVMQYQGFIQHRHFWLMRQVNTKHVHLVKR